MSPIYKIRLLILIVGGILLSASQIFATSTQPIDLGNLKLETESLSFRQTDDNFPPSDFRLDTPGVYLFTRGQALPLVASPYSFSPVSVPVRIPQTTNSTPALVVWSEEISLDTPLARFVGGIGVRLTVADNQVEVEFMSANSSARLAGVEEGDTILAINDTVLAPDIQAATSLLRGEVGTTVNVTVLRGSRRATIPITRIGIDLENIATTYTFWDDNSIVLQPTQALTPGLYCLRSNNFWCFSVTSTLNASDYTEPNLSLVPLTNVALRAELPIQVGMGSGLSYVGVFSYLDPVISDAWTFAAPEGMTITLYLYRTTSGRLPVLTFYDSSYNVIALERETDFRYSVRLTKSDYYTVVVEANGLGTQYNLQASGY